MIWRRSGFWQWKKNLAMRGNILILKVNKCTHEVKCQPFRSYCYQIFGCPLWLRFKQSTMSKLRVCYHTILRRMLGVHTWNSSKNMFVILNVCSLQEALRFATYSLSTCIEKSTNAVLIDTATSDASLYLAWDIFGMLPCTLYSFSLG